MYYAYETEEAKRRILLKFLLAGTSALQEITFQDKHSGLLLAIRPIYKSVACLPKRTFIGFKQAKRNGKQNIINIIYQSFYYLSN